ncbi:E3 ubiquitin-protein ligase CIP8 [Phytophthora cinnamomi]|uniref:E3 ubiquitin-protein ligase CIP8 n=1 Tax=Phytophthora cinnamomi TaxID=4785 RepID=UPI003559F528|nr:E3 ubiquitin-protein ligase CIP8 [Phytophthora cinnamomi]KAG6622987.1 E3 ubiquitin-protein ligase CIP8 [Phytophthora cinnamomi]
MATELSRTRRRPRRQLGLEAPAKQHLAERIASVVALSLQRNGRETDYGVLAAGKQGLLASALRLAEQNVADMTAFLRRREAEAAEVTASQEQRVEESASCCCEGEELNVCVICLDGNMSTGENALGDESAVSLPCGHVFHARCIAQWLRYRRVCPVDRRPVD